MRLLLGEGCIERHSGRLKVKTLDEGGRLGGTV